LPGREGDGTGYLGKAVLPDPSSLAADYTGKTLIGDFVRGVKDGKEHEILIYNIADHAEVYREVGSQAVSYTAGVPAAAAAILIASGEWDVRKMVNVEELPPRPLLGLLGRMGLATWIRDECGDRPLMFDTRLPLVTNATHLAAVVG
jgi:saccharopine dehydrogenase-like NADP-dependent oxidoreductase